MSSEDLPFISVIVPAYNEERTIGETIESLLAQDYPKERLEIIVVDNASKDQTAEVIKRYPVTYALEDNLQNSYAARNKGITQARGEILAFTDGDCVAHPQWLRNLITERADPKVGGFTGPTEGYQLKSAREKLENQWRHTGRHTQGKGALPGTGNVAFYRRTLEQLGPFCVESKGGGDTEMSCRMIDQTGLRFAFHPKAIIYARVSGSLFDFWTRWERYGESRAILQPRTGSRTDISGLVWHRVLRSVAKRLSIGLVRLLLVFFQRKDRVEYVLEQPLFIFRTFAEYAGACKARRLIQR